MKQPRLLHGEHLPPRIAYEKLFDCVPRLPLSPRRGRPRTDPNALLRCFVYRCQRRLPSLEWFSAWMRTTPNATLQHVRLALVGRLLQPGAIRGS